MAQGCRLSPNILSIKCNTFTYPILILRIGQLLKGGQLFFWVVLAIAVFPVTAPVVVSVAASVDVSDIVSVTVSVAVAVVVSGVCRLYRV